MDIMVDAQMDLMGFCSSALTGEGAVCRCALFGVFFFFGWDFQ